MRTAKGYAGRAQRGLVPACPPVRPGEAACRAANRGPVRRRASTHLRCRRRVGRRGRRRGHLRSGCRCPSSVFRRGAARARCSGSRLRRVIGSGRCGGRGHGRRRRRRTVASARNRGRTRLRTDRSSSFARTSGRMSRNGRARILPRTRVRINPRCSTIYRRFGSLLCGAPRSTGARNPPTILTRAIGSTSEAARAEGETPMAVTAATAQPSAYIAVRRPARFTDGA